MTDRPRRLDTWSLIAAWLHVSPRQAQRWAKRQGLPVFRLTDGADNARVYAYPDDLDAWERKRRDAAIAASEHDMVRRRMP